MHECSQAHRSFAAAALIVLFTACGPSGPLPSGVEFVEGPANGVILTQGGRRVAIYGDPRPEPAAVEAVLLTHARRDVVWEALPLAKGGAKVYAPTGERPLLEDVASYWQAYYSEGRFHDYAEQSSRILAEPLRVDERVSGDFALFDGALPVRVLETPGYTRKSVTYLFEVEGKRLAATGDLIWGDGKIHDLFSLQDAIPEANVRGYHGYAARAADVINSLRKLQAEKPDMLLPARGPLITNPEEAIGKLIARMQTLFQAYYKTDALRWYWGDDNLRLRASRVLSDAAVEWMPMANELREIPPRWMHKFNTSRLIVSDDGPAFLIDCGTDQVMQQIEDLRSRGVFTKIEGIFVTHFHDDHTDRVQAMADKCDCPVYSGPETADILERPGAYQMPAMTDIPIADVRVLQEGEKLAWHEYTFTYTYFPGRRSTTAASRWNAPTARSSSSWATRSAPAVWTTIACRTATSCTPTWATTAACGSFARAIRPIGWSINTSSRCSAIRPSSSTSWSRRSKPSRRLWRISCRGKTPTSDSTSSGRGSTPTGAKRRRASRSRCGRWCSTTPMSRAPSPSRRTPRRAGRSNR
ncbi:MAG: MBL fold metallo-hydrolase [Bryobacterales bacterium]